MGDITYLSTTEEILTHTHPCSCKACSIGCTFGSGSLVDEDIPKLASLLKISEEQLKKEYLEEIEKFNTKRFRPKLLRKDGKPFGACVFYDIQKGCTVHDAKPLECTIAMGCKKEGSQLNLWFMIKHFVNNNDAESIRQYALFLRNGGTELAGATLKELVPDASKLADILTYEKLK